MELLDRLCMEMIAYDRRDAKRIQHFIKVHSFARLIGAAEGMEAHSLFVLEAAAYVHDIGIHKAETLYSRNDGKIQEKLGPEEAEKMLRRLGFEETDIERICYLVSHHHTYHEIDGMDYQILVEADFLVNLYEDGVSMKVIRCSYDRIFRTETGRKIYREMYLDERNGEYQEWIEKDY